MLRKRGRSSLFRSFVGVFKRRDLDKSYMLIEGRPRKKGQGTHLGHAALVVAIDSCWGYQVTRPSLAQ